VIRCCPGIFTGGLALLSFWTDQGSSVPITEESYEEGVIMKTRRRFVPVGALIILAFFLMATEGFGFTGADVKFHGRAESTAIIRDITGFQYGFLDSNQWVQWRNELKFDLTVSPTYEGRPLFKLDKVFLSYRGAYDAIFDLEDRYDGLADSRREGHSRYDLGKDDLHTENDLREFFIDLLYEAPGENVGVNLRLGRQIVKWGESTFFTVLDVINPADYRSLANFANPDDLANPIIMSRLDISVSTLGPFHNLGLQLLLIPDHRPNLWGVPKGGPYGLGAVPIDFWQNDHAFGFDSMEYGVRLGASVGQNFKGYLFFWEGYNKNLAFDYTDIGLGELIIDQRRAKMVGAQGTYTVDSIATNLRAEFSMTDDMAYTDWSAPDASALTAHRTYQALVGFSKDLHPEWTGTSSALSTTMELYWRGIEKWDYAAGVRDLDENQFILGGMFSTDYVHGSICPTLLLLYDFHGPTYIAEFLLKYIQNANWYYQVAIVDAFGDANSTGKYAAYIGGATAEISFRVGYQW